VWEERELNAQFVRDINEKLDSALDKITRLETQQNVPVREDELHVFGHKTRFEIVKATEGKVKLQSGLKNIQ